MCAGSRRPRVGASAVLALLAALPLSQGDGGDDDYLVVKSTITKILEGQTKVIDHCFYEQSTYTPYLPDHWGTASATTYHECQRRCVRQAVCFYFTFFSETKECHLAGQDAIFEMAPADKGATVAGPRMCPKFPAGCTEMPGAGFPGQTADESKLAWPWHRVPQNMECWPKNWTTDAYLQCKTFKTLENTFTGWPGKCRGMSLVLVPHLESCESYCKKKLICAAFQEVQTDKPFGPKTCWHADATSGIDCYERKHDPDFAPLSAKRFMRGNVRVLMNLQGVEVLGLHNVFPETYFIHVEDAAKACRYHCYSNLICQYWQYYLGSGCWVEDPVHTNGNPVPYPATTSSWLVGSPRSRTVLDGEYIQHVCFEAGEPGRQVKSEWTLVGEHNNCPQDILKNLGGTGGNLDACKQLTLGDAGCGNQMYSDGWQCSCVQRGQVCSVSSGRTDSNLYEHKMVRTESKLMKFAEKHGANVMKAHGFQKLDWIKNNKEGKIFEVTITVDGLHFSAIGPTQQVILIGRYVPAVAAALEVPSSSITDLHNNPGSMELFHGASPNQTKVSFAVLTTATKTSGLDVRDRLRKESFIKHFENITTYFAPGAVNTGVNVTDVAVVRRGGAIPHHGEQAQKRAARRAERRKAMASSQAGSSVFGFGTFLMVGLGAGCLLVFQQRMRQQDADPCSLFQPGGGGETSSGSESGGEAELTKPLGDGRPYGEFASNGGPARQVVAQGY